MSIKVMCSVCHVFCISYHRWHHNSVLNSESGLVLHRLEIIRLVLSQRSPHSFHWLPACHSSRKKSSPWSHGYLTCLEWTWALEICSRPPGAGWQRSRSSQKTLLLSFTFAVIQDRFTRPFFLPLCSACLPSTDQGLLSVSFAPATFSHFCTDLLFHLITPKSQDCFGACLLSHSHTTVLTDLPPPPVKAADLFVSQCI